MAIKASTTVTLSCYRDTESVTRYYKLQSSTTSAPPKPTDNPPSGWDDSEPSYTSGSTNTLYFCDLTVFSDGTWSYSTVSKSSSYEAAKEAYNKAENAQMAADEAAKVATNYMEFSNIGLVIGDMTGSTLGRNILIDSDSVDIRNGDTVLASYGEDYIYIGKNTQSAIINLADGVGILYNEDSELDFQRLVIEANHSIKLSTQSAIYQNVFYDNGVTSGSAYIHAATYEPWGADADITYGRIEMYVDQEDGSNSNIKMKPDNIFLRTEYTDSGYCGIEMTGKTGDATILGSGIITLGADYTHTTGHLVLPNAHRLFGETAGGVQYNGFEVSTSGNMVYGYGSYENGAGRTNIYGNHIWLKAKQGGDTWFKPYYASGDSVSGTWWGAGFVTTSKTSVCFTIPLSKPVVGSPNVTVENYGGFILRQGNSYTHGSSSTMYVDADSLTGTLDFDGNCVRINAKFSTTTNCTNNDAIGITAGITITFS